MKIGYTVWTWLMDEHNDWKPFSPNGKRDFEQSLKEVSDLGYEVFENFNIMVDLFEDSPDEFDDLIEKYQLEFVNIYHYLKDNFPAEMEMAERCCKFNNRHGAELMNIQAPSVSDGDTTIADLEDLCRKLTEMGELAKEHSIALCLHPHYGTTCYLEDEIDFVLEHVNRDLLSLCIDTAHTFLAGMDPQQAFTKYMDRIRYVHLKDVDPTISAKGISPMRGFSALGQGVIGFRGVADVLKEASYDGVLTVECDYNRVCNYETAMVSREYIHRVLGM